MLTMLKSPELMVPPPTIGPSSQPPRTAPTMPMTTFMRMPCDERISRPAIHPTIPPTISQRMMFIASSCGSRPDADLVAHGAHARDIARNDSGGIAFGGVLGESGKHHGAVEGFDLDARSVDIAVVDKTRLDAGGDRRIVDVGAHGL